MTGFVAGADRGQAALLPECLDDWVDESNPVRAVDVFVDALDLRDLGFAGVDPAATGRPALAISSAASSRTGRKRPILESRIANWVVWTPTARPPAPAAR